MRPDAILIAGPTASGKSALAVRLARSIGGDVVNADALQVYGDLRILTARPRPAEMGEVTHHLYGHVPADRSYSVGDWMREVANLLPTLPQGRVPVFCGGTGLYFRALLGGLDAMPPVPEAIRLHWRDRGDSEPSDRLHAELRARDEAAAARIRSSDRQRIIRALELFETTGRPLAELQTRSGTGLFALSRVRAIVLAPPRDELRRRIAQRFTQMMDEGAQGEALRFAEAYGTTAPLAEKAIGLRELIAAARGELDRDAAVDLAVTRTRQYAKRQETWFRNQFGTEWVRYASALDVPVD